MPSSSRKPRTWMPPCQPAAYCPRAVPGGQVVGQPDRGQHLLLLRAQRVRVEGDRLLHRGERQQLHQVVLDHVPGRADAVVVPGPAADADVLGHGDLHVVHVAAVPDRLVQRVGEAQRQDVLDRLLAQVVVDAEDRVRAGTPRSAIAFSSRALARSWPNGFSITTRRHGRVPPGPARGGVGQPGPLELLDHHAGRTSAGPTGRTRSCRRCRARRRARRRSAASRSNASSSANSPGTNRTPSDSCCQTVSRNGVRACSLTASWVTWAKSSSSQSRRAKPTSEKPGGSRPAVGQVVDGRHQLLAGQVAGHAEDDQDARARHPRDAPVPRVAQRVGHRPGDHRASELGCIIGFLLAQRAAPASVSALVMASPLPPCWPRWCRGARSRTRRTSPRPRPPAPRPRRRS